MAQIELNNQRIIYVKESFNEIDDLRAISLSPFITLTQEVIIHNPEPNTQNRKIHINKYHITLIKES